MSVRSGELLTTGEVSGSPERACECCGRLQLLPRCAPCVRDYGYPNVVSIFRGRA